jgi:hypothetical protein
VDFKTYERNRSQNRRYKRRNADKTLIEIPHLNILRWKSVRRYDDNVKGIIYS